MKITGFEGFLTRVGNRPRVLVRVDTDEGISGWGEAYNHGPDEALFPVFEYMFAQIMGEDPRRVEHLTQKITRLARFPQGAIGLAALSAIDHALWEISAIALNVPVYQLLGGRVRDRVPVYCGLYTAPDAEVARDQTAELNETYGLTAFKLSPWRVDIHAQRWGLVVSQISDYFGEVRAAADPRWDFAFDAHAQVFEPYRAIELGNALAPYQPMFFEEPMRPEHIPSWQHVRAQLRVPLATGESLYSPHEFLALLTAGGVDIAQPDIAVVGGLSQMRRIATLAETHNVMIAPHNPMGPLATAHNLHFAAACSNFFKLEYKFDDTTWCPDPYLPVDGHLELREDRPGWGVTIDEEALRASDTIVWNRALHVRPDGSWAWA